MKIGNNSKEKNQRHAISKKIRFNIFKRDNFTCQYCGNTPPSVVLEIDHIHPVYEGGNNDIDNLITACFDCNRGKGKETLSVIPQSIEAKKELIIEKEEQLKAYNKVLKAKKTRETKTINNLDNIYQEVFPDYEFSESFRVSIRGNFLPHLTEDQLEKALKKAIWKTKDDAKCLKYFCGICWRVIRGEGDGSI